MPDEKRSEKLVELMSRRQARVADVVQRHTKHIATIDGDCSVYVERLRTKHAEHIASLEKVLSRSRAIPKRAVKRLGDTRKFIQQISDENLYLWRQLTVSARPSASRLVRTRRRVQDNVIAMLARLAGGRIVCGRTHCC